MKRNCRRMVGMITVLCMLMTMVAVPALADNPTGTKVIFANFDGLTYESALSAYGMKGNMKVNESGGSWESTAKVEPAVDAQGNATDAVHFYWDNPETVTQKSVGTDPHLIVTSLDYSGAAVTSFDVKLDNDISRFMLNYRYEYDTSVKGLDFAYGSVYSGMVLMGQNVNLKVEADKWYHITIATIYDAANNVIRGSAWVNGVLLVEGAELPYTYGADRINGNSSNMLRFWSYYNDAASDEKKPGIWIDNITFDQLGTDAVYTNPKNGDVTSDSTVTFTFGADIDPSTFDTNAIKVLKSGESITPVSAELIYNSLRIKLSNDGNLDNGNYIVQLPEGIKDVFGYEIPESSRTLSFSGYKSTAAVDTVSVTSPSAESKLTYGKAVVIKASAAANEQVTFYANDIELGTSVADINGVCSFTWTPNIYGIAALTAKDSNGVSASIPVHVMQAAQFSKTSPASSSLITDGSSPVDSNHTEVYKLTKGASFGPTNMTAITSGVWELNIDSYTDESGNGANISSVVTYSNGTANQWIAGIIKLTGGAVICNNGNINVGTCTPNTWYNIRIVFDIDNFAYSVYLNGVQVVADVGFPAIQAMTRIKVESTSTTAVCYTPLYLYTLSEVSMDCSVVVTSPANGTMIEKNQPIALTAAAAKPDGTTADTLSFYQDGTKLGDAVKQADGTFAYTWTPAESGNTGIYAIASADGKNYVSDKINVKVLGDAANTWNTKSVTPNGGTVKLSDDTLVTENTSNLSGDEKITMLYDGSGAPYTEVKISSTTSGIVVAEFDVTFEDTASSLQMYNRNTGENKAQNGLSMKNGVVTCYNGTTRVNTTAAYAANVPVHVKTLWNLDQMKVDIYINNVRLPEQTIIRSDYVDVLSLRFASDSKGYTITMQNENVRYIPANPEVSSVAVKDANGNVLNALKMTADNIASIDVTYDIALSSSTVSKDNVKLYRGSGTDAQVPVNVTLTNNGQTISVSPLDSSTIVSGALYRLEITDGVLTPAGGKADKVNYSFRTLIEGRGAQNGIFKKNGTEINSISDLAANDVITFTADVTDSVAEKNVWVVLAVYGNGENGKILKNVSITKQGLASVNTNVSGSLTLTNAPESGDTLYAYVWTGAMVPFGDEFPLN